MPYSKSNTIRSISRLISLAVAVVILLASMLVSAEDVSAASRLKVSVTKKTIYVGQTTKLKSNIKVKWKVSNKKTAKLTGVKKKSVTVKGLKAGTVYVTAKAGEKTKKIKITIKAKEKLTLKANQDTIGQGEYCYIFAYLGKKPLESKYVIFSSSNEKVAYIDDRGLVMGLRKGSVTITAQYKKDKSIKAKIRVNIIPARAGKITLTVDLSDESRYEAGKEAKVWLPVPQNDDHQSISTIRYNTPAENAITKMTNDSGGGKQLYVEWDENTVPKDRIVTLSYHIYRRAVVNDGTIASKEKGTIDKEAFAEYLQETYWSGSFKSGIVKETADKIVEDANAKTVYDKAFAIYDWMCDNMIRTDDKTVIFGDVVSILEGKRNAGSCMDMNSVFVALCRAEGIPARNLFGLRFTTGGPNCRAEFYLPGYGWVPTDPALAIKEGRKLDGAPRHDHDPVWEGIKAKYWGNAEENWICLNMGRDITLDPAQSVNTKGEYLEVLNPDGTINLFMFPYGEFDGNYIPCQNRANFKYEYKFDEEDPADCGC